MYIFENWHMASRGGGKCSEFVGAWLTFEIKASDTQGVAKIAGKVWSRRFHPCIPEASALKWFLWRVLCSCLSVPFSCAFICYHSSLFPFSDFARWVHRLLLLPHCCFCRDFHLPRESTSQCLPHSRCSYIRGKRQKQQILYAFQRTVFSRLIKKNCWDYPRFKKVI